MDARYRRVGKPNFANIRGEAEDAERLHDEPDVKREVADARQARSSRHPSHREEADATFKE